MKRLFLSALLMCFAYFVSAQGYETVANNGSKMYVGFINDSLLKTDSAFSWFAKAQNAYKQKEAVVKAFEANRDSVNFLVFVGTWCPDSHYVVPRFFSILDTVGFNKKNITMIAVDSTKQDKNRLTRILKVTNVPTIIVFKNGKELGRVVEYGETGRFDLELAALLTKS